MLYKSWTYHANSKASDGYLVQHKVTLTRPLFFTWSQINDWCQSYYSMLDYTMSEVSFSLWGRGVCLTFHLGIRASRACNPAHTNNGLHENTKLEMLDPPLSQTIVRCKSTFTQLGAFSRMRIFGNIAHRAGGGNKKKKFTHKATPARCASQYTRSCCIFLGSYMLSFDTQRSHGVRDAPSHGNSPGGAFTRCKIALEQWRVSNSVRVSNLMVYIGSPRPVNDLRRGFLVFPAVGLATFFCFARSGSDVANSSVW